MMFQIRQILHLAKEHLEIDFAKAEGKKRRREHSQGRYTIKFWFNNENQIVVKIAFIGSQSWQRIGGTQTHAGHTHTDLS